jgi:hypothetical protein|tara:strand:+ start:443 stop:559 length:117 start_codon:yes stop_codon:yes gene_type:complete
MNTPDINMAGIKQAMLRLSPHNSADIAKYEIIQYRLNL